jgi:hypothetical protein
VSAYEVDAADMRDAMSRVPGVQHVLLEFDSSGNGVLRVQVGPDADADAVVGQAVGRLRQRFGLGVDASRLRLTGPSGRTVIAVVERLDVLAADPLARVVLAEGAGELLAGTVAGQLPDPAATTTSTRYASPELHGRCGARRPVPGPVTAAGLDATLDVVLGVGDVVLGVGEGRVDAHRVLVERIEVATERLEVRATVHLRLGGASHSGTATGTVTGSGSRRAVATATARALEAAVGSSARLDVEAVDLLQIGRDQVGVVVLTLLSDRGFDRLTGSALARRDERDTVVRATLDALNRRAQSLSTGAEDPPRPLR